MGKGPDSPDLPKYNKGGNKMTEDVLERILAELASLKEEFEAFKTQVDKKLPIPTPPLPKVPSAPRRPLFGGHRGPVRMVDTETGKEYPSKYALGKELAHLAGTTPEDHMAFYKLLTRFPGRFKELG